METATDIGGFIQGLSEKFIGLGGRSHKELIEGVIEGWRGWTDGCAAWMDAWMDARMDSWMG